MEEKSKSVVKEPFNYLSHVKGKAIRTKLVDAFQIWIPIPEHISDTLKDVIETLHVSSMLVDDIEDSSDYRRGKLSAHKVYGVPWTINSSNYMIFLSMYKVISLNNMEAINVFIKEILNLHLDQGMDLYWRDTHQCPTEQEYEAMVINKTGGLFRLVLNFMKCFSDVSEKTSRVLDNIVNLLGLFYQIRDDLLSLTSEEYMKNKVFCEDVEEGKFSFCIIHSVHFDLKNRTLLEILKIRTKNVDAKRKAIDDMESTGSFDYSRKRLNILKKEIVVEMEKVGGNKIIKSMLKKLTY